MGTSAHVVVVGGDEARLIDAARRRLDDLERRWSRFLPGSEISRLNRRPDRPVVVSPDTFGLVARSVDAWHATGGRFDPTVLPAMLAAGYDRDFAEVALAALPLGSPLPSPGCGGIRLDPAVSAVWLPAGVGVDPGGIGKGLAADLVSRELVEAGAAGVLVNVGGDLRVRGTPPAGDEWTVAVEDPADGARELARFGLTSGAVATSSRLRRRWHAGDRDVHHLIDPTTGSAAQSDVTTVTVVAADAWWAEALATALCVSPAPAALRSRRDASILIVRADGTTITTPELQAVLR